MRHMVDTAALKGRTFCGANAANVDTAGGWELVTCPRCLEHGPCTECGGFGSMTFDRVDHNGNHETEEVPCPKCSPQ